MYEMYWMDIIKLFLLFNFITKAICLKDLKISVPEAVAAEDTVTLSCYYDLENAALYSIRWYLDQEEFYRYVPKETPPARVFEIRGITVDLSKSTENSVILRSVNRNQSGNYQCEVSADAPLFHTESSGATMLIAELPESEPVITIYGMPGADNKRIVTLGETFKASCVSGPSNPPVNFTWLVNDMIFPKFTRKIIRRHICFRKCQIYGQHLWKAMIAIHEFVHNGSHKKWNCFMHLHSAFMDMARAMVMVNFMSTHSGLRNIESMRNDIQIDSKEAWSELVVHVDNHIITLPFNRKLLVRCETNIYSLYKGAAEAELNVIDDNYWSYGGKVSPTIDQRGNRGDPDNSALTGNSALLKNNSIFQNFLIEFVLILLLLSRTIFLH